MKKILATALLAVLCTFAACADNGNQTESGAAAGSEAEMVSPETDTDTLKTDSPEAEPETDPTETAQLPDASGTADAKESDTGATESETISPEQEDDTEKTEGNQTPNTDAQPGTDGGADTAETADEEAEAGGQEGDAGEAADSEPENDAGEEEPAEPVSVGLDSAWEFAGFSVIHSGTATLYYAGGERKDIVVGVNAGHGTQGGGSVYTQCHPDGTPKVTGGTTAAGALEAMAVSSGMTFFDGTPERDVTLREAQILKELLLQAGYDVLMLRDGDDVQLDNIARTVICNNTASCHIAIHWDGDGLDYDKGCFYMSVPDGIKEMYPVSGIWQEDDRLGESLIEGLISAGCPIMSDGSMPMDLTQTSYSSIPSVDIELGNAASDHSEEALYARASGLLAGINIFFGMS